MLDPAADARGDRLCDRAAIRPRAWPSIRGLSCTRPLVAILVILVASGGCAERQYRTLTPPERVQSLDKRSPYLKAHMRDGSVYVLSRWGVDEAAGSVSGEGILLGPERRALTQGPVTIPIESVALFETNVVQKSPNVAALAVVTGVSVAMTGYCIANPKACFGSCPTFYVSEGERPDAEGFSDSVAPSLEARDIDALYRARPTKREFEIRMKNEALETHIVRYVRTLAARRPEGGRVFATETGEFWQATDIREPQRCTAPEGDCLAAVRRFDGRERFSATDPQDLASREVVEVDFGPVGGDGPIGLVVGSRQTFLSTFLFYQGLAYMGSTAGDWLARLERGEGVAVSRVNGLGRALGGIEVLLEEAGGRWVPAAELHEAGPLASDVKVVPMPRRAPGPLKVRLRMTRGHWRIDYLALARLGARVEPIRLDPVDVRKGDSPVPRWPSPGLTTLPGDEYRFTYTLPKDPGRYELFLGSRGYYLEWMREEWLSEENLERAALLFGNPERALRLLAPEFKRQEAEMEDLFWRSRYVEH